MPTIPISINRQPISGAQYPVPGPEQFGSNIGRQLEASGQVFERIQAGYDAATSVKLEGEGSASLEGALVDAKTKFNDPKQYKDYLDAKIPEIYESTLEQAPNAQVRRNVEARLANNKRQAEVKATYGFYEKTKDVALANALDVENRMLDQATATQDPMERNKIVAQYGQLMGQLKANNYIDADRMQARLERFNDKVIGDSMALYARRDPLGFGDAADQGKLLEQYPGANASQIQKATEIADRTINIKQARERQLLADESIAVKRSAYDQASRGELSDTRIAQMQEIYKWTDDTAKDLQRINRGLKEDNPYKEQLIADAMSPLAKGTVSLNDVAAAERGLNALAGRGVVSADSTEYRRAMNQIKNERNRLTFQGDIRSNQAERNAHYQFGVDKSRAANLINRYQPELDGEQHKKRMGTINDDLDAMRNDPAGRKKYLDNIEAELKDKQKNRQNWKPKSDGLRSLKK